MKTTAIRAHRQARTPAVDVVTKNNEPFQIEFLDIEPARVKDFDWVVDLINCACRNLWLPSFHTFPSDPKIQGLGLLNLGGFIHENNNEWC